VLPVSTIHQVVIKGAKDLRHLKITVSSFFTIALKQISVIVVSSEEERVV